MRKPYLLFCGAIFWLFSLASPLLGTQYKPWFGKVHQVEARVTGTFEHYDEFIHSWILEQIKSHNSLTTLSLNVTPYERWNAEIEMCFVRSFMRTFCFDSLKATGRYLIFNDLRGDYVSLTAGLSLTQAFGKAVEDPATYHHGKLAAALHSALGKEFVLNDCYKTRIWGVAGYGKADENDPWWWWEADWEGIYKNKHKLRAFFYYQQGLGDSLSHYKTRFPPQVIGQTNYNFREFGGRYTIVLARRMEISLEYAHRRAQHFGFSNVHIYRVELYAPFSYK